MDDLVAAGAWTELEALVAAETLVAITLRTTGIFAGTFIPPGVSTGTGLAAGVGFAATNGLMATDADCVAVTFLRAGAGDGDASAFALRFFSGVLRQSLGSLRIGMLVLMIGLEPVRLEPPLPNGGEGPPLIALRDGVDGATTAGVDAVKMS